MNILIIVIVFVWLLFGFLTFCRHIKEENIVNHHTLNNRSLLSFFFEGVLMTLIGLLTTIAYLIFQDIKK